MNTSNPLAGARVAGTVGKPLPGIADARRRRRRRAHSRRGTSARCRCADRTCSPATGACRRRRARNSPRTASSRPATWANGLPMVPARATCGSSAAPRTSSSPAASMSIRRKSRSGSTRWTAWSRPRSSACPIPTSASASPRSSSRDPGHALTEGGIIAALKADIASFKVPEARAFRRRPAAQCHGQGPEERACARRIRAAAAKSLKPARTVPRRLRRGVVSERRTRRRRRPSRAPRNT